MTYSSGGLIQATDYNGFVSTTSGSNINDVWGTGTGDKGWGQTSLSTVSSTNTVTATQWSGLVNTLASMGNQTNSTLTSRTAPTSGQTIGILANVATDITTVTTNRGNAAASGTTSSTWTGNTAVTSATGSGGSPWSLIWTHTVTFASADAARYFWNAGGLVRIDMSKTSTGTDSDADWNTFVGTVGTFYISGRVNSAAQTIAGTSYTGFTRVGGTGTPSPNLTTTGWYTLTPGAAATTMMTLTNTATGYTNDTISIAASIDSGSTVLTITTTWADGGSGGAGTSRNISGGTDTASPFTTFGTAPAVLVRYVPPSTSYLTASWGTPTVAVVPTIGYLLVAGGGSASAWSGGGGGGGFIDSATRGTVYTLVSGRTYTATVGGAGSNSTLSSTADGTIFTAYAGGNGAQNATAGSGGSGGGAVNCSGAGGKGVYPGSSYISATRQGYDAYASYGGGGGGAGAASTGPNGGTGAASSITGSAVYYAGGGGAGQGSGGPNCANSNGSGGTGGGGTGADIGNNSAPQNGTANTGGGGGGGWYQYGNGGSQQTSGTGGSGVVILRIPTSIYTGTVTGSPTVTTDGSYTVVKFTGTGTYTA